MNDIIIKFAETFGLSSSFVLGTIIVTYVYGYSAKKRKEGDDFKKERLAFFLDKISSLNSGTRIKTVPNRYIIEQMFLERTGKLVDYRELIYLLSTDSPSKNIGAYVKSSGFFEYSLTLNKLILKHSMTRVKIKNSRRVNNIKYYLYSYLASGGVLLVKYGYVESIPNMILILFMFFGFLLMAGISLGKNIEANSALALCDRLGL